MSVLESAMGSTRPFARGVALDPETRCAHYHSPLDIVALKMRCCRTYYACRQCHDELADHAARLWSVEEAAEIAAMCGACGGEMTIGDYLACEDRCPACGAPFNPGCRGHRHLYFEGPNESAIDR